jgi:hypothetical protein
MQRAEAHYEHHTLSASGGPCGFWLSSPGSPVFGMDVQQASPPPSSAQVQPYSDATYPQIVRISYVRVSRGTRRATWETAVTGLPLEGTVSTMFA